MFQKLQAWQDANGVDDKELAQRVGVDRSTIYRAKRGQRVISIDTQLRIQKHTKIPPTDWTEFYAQIAATRARPQKKSEQDRVAAIIAEVCELEAEA
jgi:transcriptional regulator with XRE-family HTH domain